MSDEDPKREAEAAVDESPHEGRAMEALTPIVSAGVPLGPSLPLEPPEVAKSASDGQNRVGDYVLVRELGHGGAGTVFQAWHKPLARWVALKFLHERDPGAVERLRREARMVARLTHPHIVPLFEVGEHEGRPFLTFRLIRGRTLSRIQLEPRRAAEVMRDVAEAVHYAHENGVIHRDLKPQNMMLDEDGHAWVMDFGLARSAAGGTTLTVPGVVLGTPEYMAPEQAVSGRTDRRSDVYGLGATLYALLAGRAPFEGKGALEVMMKVVRDEPVSPRRLNPRIHPDLDAIVEKAMDKDPARRYASARALADDLRRYLLGEVVTARTTSRLVRAWRWARRHPAAAALLAVAAAATLALSGGAFLYAATTGTARRAAEERLAQSLVSEGNALVAARRWHEARDRYREARMLFDRLGLDDAGPGLGLLDVDQQALPPLWTIEGHRGHVRKVTFRADGRRAFTCGEDGRVVEWDVATARAVRELGAAGPAVMGIALSPDDRHLAAADVHGLVRVWNLRDGTPILELPAHKRKARGVAFSPDGTRLATSGEDGTLALWRLSDGAELWRRAGGGDAVRSLAFSNDGAEIAAAGSGAEQLTIWSVDEGVVVRSLRGHSEFVSNVRYAPSGHRVVSAGIDRTARVWDLRSGTSTVLDEHGFTVADAVFLGDDEHVLTASFDGRLRVWDVRSGREIWRYTSRGQPSALGLSPDGRLALSGTKEGALELWDLGSRHSGALFGWLEQPGSVGLSHDGRIFLTQGPLSLLRLWDRATSKTLLSVECPACVVGSRLAFSNDARWGAVAGVDHSVALLDLRRKAPLVPLGRHEDLVFDMYFSADDRRLVTAGRDGRVIMWDVEGQCSLWQAQGEWQWSAATTPDGGRVVHGDHVGRLHVRDGRTGRLERSIDAHGTAQVVAVAISRDGRRALSGSNDRKVMLWDLDTGARLRIFEGHAGEIGEVGFDADNRLAISTGTDDYVRVWDLRTGRELHSYLWRHGLPRARLVTPDGRFVSLAGEDGAVALWDFAEPARREILATRLEAALTGPLDPGRKLALGAWYAYRGMAPWALELVEAAVTEGAGVSSLELARIYWRGGRLTDARAAFERALVAQEAPEDYLRLCIDAVAREEETDVSSRRPRLPGPP